MQGHKGIRRKMWNMLGHIEMQIGMCGYTGASVEQGNEKPSEKQWNTDISFVQGLGFRIYCLLAGWQWGHATVEEKMEATVGSGVRV